jgi:hypothetical protein
MLTAPDLTYATGGVFLCPALPHVSRGGFEMHEDAQGEEEGQ